MNQGIAILIILMSLASLILGLINLHLYKKKRMRLNRVAYILCFLVLAQLVVLLVTIWIWLS